MGNFLLRSDNVEKSSFIWNMTGSMLVAFQSVILLMIITRTVGLIEAGIFTIAYANANLFLNIGKYGMRNFQVSDVTRQFSFSEYHMSRRITTLAMLIVSMIYVLWSAFANEYSLEKTAIIIWMCIFKLPDAIEDVYYGDYQKKGRLDVGGKALALRLFFTLILFSICLVVFKNLLWSLRIATVATFLIMIYFIGVTKREFYEEPYKDNRNVVTLLKQCFPLAMGAFLSFYIGNAPKYAIDSMLSDEIQACYGFIAMPVFVIGLLNGFIFNPILYKISALWNQNKIKEFLSRVVVQVVIIVLITFICIIGAYIIGIPVLSLLYNTDLSSYKTELMLLLLGGGFLGLTGLLSTVITIIRCQTGLLYGYGLVALLAFVFSNPIVSKFQMRGAALLYVFLMLLLSICFSAVFIYGVLKNIHRSKTV